MMVAEILGQKDVKLYSDVEIAVIAEKQRNDAAGGKNTGTEAPVRYVMDEWHNIKDWES